MMLSVRRFLLRLAVAALLATCVGIYALEMSGRWDQSIKDANDEAGFVAIVLCIGIAFSTAGAFVARIRPPRAVTHVTFAARTPEHRGEGDLSMFCPASTTSPPLRLRI